MSEKVWNTLNPAEKRREYVYADGGTLAFEDVRRVAVSASGTHYLETGNGMKHVVAAGWRCVTLDVEAWTF